MFVKRHFYTAHTNSYQCESVHTLHTKAFDAYFAYHPYLYNSSTFCLYEADHVYEVSFLIQCIPIPTSMKHCTFGFLCCVCVWGGGGAYRILCIPCRFSRELRMFVKRHFYTVHTHTNQCETLYTRSPWGVEYRILCIRWQFSRKLPMFMKRHYNTAHTNAYQ